MLFSDCAQQLEVLKLGSHWCLQWWALGVNVLASFPAWKAAVPWRHSCSNNRAFCHWLQCEGIDIRDLQSSACCKMQYRCRRLGIQNKVIAPSSLLSTKLGWLCRGVAGKDPDENITSYHSDYHNKGVWEEAVLPNDTTGAYCPHKSRCIGTDLYRAYPTSYSVFKYTCKQALRKKRREQSNPMWYCSPAFSQLVIPSSSEDFLNQTCYVCLATFNWCLFQVFPQTSLEYW